MLRSVRLLATAIALFALTACTATTPGWTYAPAPSPTPIPSADGSAEPSGGASVAPSAGASTEPSASAAPSASTSAAPSGSGTVLEISAQNIAFDTGTLTAPVDEPFQIHFVNNDASVPHNVAIHEGTPTGPEVFQGEVFPGVAERTYDVPGLPAGTYGFVCTVHPNMTGTLTAG
jgi:plastocyanin